MGGRPRTGGSAGVEGRRRAGGEGSEPDAGSVVRGFGVGERVVSMRRVAGAWSNRMYLLETDRGEFAVKQLLDPWHDPRWSDWIDEAWRFELAAWRAGVPMPAPIANPTTGGWRADVAVAGGRGATVAVRVHRWVRGSPMYAAPVTMHTARWGGRVLATLHGLAVAPVDRSLFPRPDTVTAQRWPELVGLARRHGAVWSDQIADLAGTVAAMARLAEAAPDRSGAEVMSHGDLDQKNIILTGAGPVLCDWDVAAPVLPVSDLAHVALSLAGWTRLDIARGVVAGYRAAGGTAVAARPEDLGPRLMVGLDWIAFNVERAVGLHDATAHEVALGNQLVPELLARLPRRLDATLNVARLFGSG
jgi:Ser/Thr protein kinase RdoA (MazF antagonist)